MKMFTTAAALAARARAPDRDQGLPRRPDRRTASYTAASTCRAAATRRSAPRLLQRLPGRPGDQPVRAAAADPRRRDQTHHRPPLRRRLGLRPPPRRRRLRLRDQLLHRPALRPRLQLRLQRQHQRQRLLLRPGKARGLEAGALAARRRDRVPARVALARRRPSAERVAIVHSPPLPDRRATDVYSDNFFAEMLIKLLGAEFGNAGTTAAGAAVVATSPVARLRRPRGRRLRPDPLQPRLAARGDRPAAGDAQAEVGDEFIQDLALTGPRARSPAACGTAAYRRCRVKTGTLTGVSNLSGYCFNRAAR